MELYGADICPFVHRVRLALHLKNLDFVYHAIDLANKPDWYHEVLPSGKVPLLEDGEFRIWESMIILEYLEESYPEPALYPGSPGEKAMVRLEMEQFSGKFIGGFYGVLRAQESAKRDEMVGEMTSLLEDWSDKVPTDGFFGGADPGLFDIAIYPWFNRWPVLEHYRGFSLPEGPWRSWSQRMADTQAVKDTARSPNYYVGLYESYAKGER